MLTPYHELQNESLTFIELEKMQLTWLTPTFLPKWLTPEDN